MLAQLVGGPPQQLADPRLDALSRRQGGDDTPRVKGDEIGEAVGQ